MDIITVRAGSVFQSVLGDFRLLGVTRLTNVHLLVSSTASNGEKEPLFFLTDFIFTVWKMSSNIYTKYML